MQKAASRRACSCVCPVVQLHGWPSSHPIMGDGPRGTPVGLHSTLFGVWGKRDMRRSRQSRHLQGFHLVIHGALAVVLIVRSSRRRPGRLRPAEERCDRTVWRRAGLSPGHCRPHLPHCGSGALRWRETDRNGGGGHRTHTTLDRSLVTQPLSHFTAPFTHRARLDRGPAQWV